VLGSARWWQAEANAYRRTLDRPLPTRTTIRDSAGAQTLVLEVLDSAWRIGARSPLMPDHGKLAHLFIARSESLDDFAHLHPTMPNETMFETPLPALPPGKYRLFADVVHENGMQRTLTDSVTIESSDSAPNDASLDADDSWFRGHAVRAARDTIAWLSDSATIKWVGPRAPAVGQVGVLRFALHDRAGAPLQVEPYLGMLGHAVVMRRDGGVFVHLHPSGTSSMASELAFAIRDRGDTTAEGRLRLDAHEATMQMPLQPQRIDAISFPYAFPSTGAYRVWVQLRVSGRIRTAAFDVDVAPAQEPIRDE
jgi:hypothetical protein